MHINIKAWAAAAGLALLAALPIRAAVTVSAPAVSALVGGSATPVLALDFGVPSYDMLALAVNIDYDGSLLSLGAADVMVTRDGNTGTLFDFLALLDTLDGPFISPFLDDGPGTLSFNFFGVDTLPITSGLSFAPQFQLLPAFAGGAQTGVRLSGSSAIDSSDPNYVPDEFDATALIAAIAPSGVLPEPGSAALLLVGLALLAPTASSRRRLAGR